MGIFDFFFKRDPPREETRITTVNVQGGSCSTWTGSAYANDIFRGAVDSIARHFSKLKIVHVTLDGSGYRQPSNDCRLQRILQISPNEFMTSAQFLYKMATHYYLHGNAFAVLDWDSLGQLSGIYPVNYSHVDFAADETGRLFVKFRFRNGREGIFEYSDVIHLRRYFNGNEILGDDNRALDPTLALAHTQAEGLTNSIKAAAHIRGLLKIPKVLAEDVLREKKKAFIRDYLSVDNDGGLVVTDATFDYVPLENKPVNLDEGQLKLVRDKIYNYMGISEKIVNSSYTEDEFAAFLEGTIEPLANFLAQEMTRRIFTEREQSFGNQIILDSGRLFTSNKTKVDLIEKLLPYGLLTINQALEILNFAPVEDGDRRLQSLNFVDAQRVTEYQLGKAGIKNAERISDGGDNNDGADET